MKTLTLWNDPIIAELHAVRAKLVREAGNDIHQLVLNAKKAAQALRIQSNARTPIKDKR